jgi:protein-disulfide isomerase
MTTRRVLLVLIGAAALSVGLIATSQLGARDREEAPAAAGATHSSLARIPQRGIVLGDPDAPVTLVEYADLQCPYCAEWATRTFPVLVSDYVRTGKLRIVFHGLAFIGPDSDAALRTALAAGRENRLWDVVAGFYLRQGAENAGWVTDDLVDDVVAEAGLDGDDVRDARDESWVSAELRAAQAAADAAGVHGTPSFQLGRTGRALELVHLRSLGPEGITPAIDTLLRR